MDFTLRKDATTQPPHYIVIFKAKDADNMEQAFKEFTAKRLQREERPPRSARTLPQAGKRQPPATLTGPREKFKERGAVTMKPEMKKLIIATEVCTLIIAKLQPFTPAFPWATRTGTAARATAYRTKKNFLENYAKGQHLTNIRHYIDDDESGRFF